MNKEEKKIGRRDYLKYASAGIGGLIVGGAIGYLSKPVGVVEKTITKTETVGAATVTKTETATKTVTSPLPPKEIEVVVWAIGPDPPSEYRFKNFQIAQELLNTKLSVTNSPVKIKVSGEFFVRPTEWEEYRKKFYLAFEAKGAPDIYCTGHEDIAYLAEKGYIIPLDDYIKQYWDTTYYDIISTLWNAVIYKGKKWAIPQDTEVRPLYYRIDHLRELDKRGKLPDKFKPIEAIPEKVKNKEILLYDVLELAKIAKEELGLERGIVHRVKEGYDYLQFYLGFGGRLWDPTTGKMVFSKESWRKTFKWFYDAVWEYKVILPTQFSGDWDKDFHAPFTKGTTLFCSGGSWHKGEWISKGLLTEEDFKNNVGFMLHPAGDVSYKPVTLSHPLVYVITTQAKDRGKADISALLVSMVTDPHLNAKHAILSTHLAILYSEINDSEYSKDWFLKEVASMLDYTTFLPSHGRWGDYSKAVFATLRAVESGELKPDEATSTLESDLKRALGEEILIE
ncbi:MAG: extracellular solute-binding protein [Candidatus Methanomethylicia archaeon]